MNSSWCAVVLNPKSVDRTALRSAVADAAEQAGWDESRWFETDAEDGGADAVARALAAGPTSVLAVGGDGTVRVIAGAVQGTGVPMAIVPGGTGNLFARNLDIPVNDLARGVRAAFTGTDRPIDVGRIELERPDGTTEEQPFLVMAGIGLDAHMAAHTNSRLKKRFGWVAYSDPIARSVVGNRQIDLRYALDGHALQPLRAHTVIIGNCGTLTANMLLLPDAQPDDGLLDAVAFRPTRRGGWPMIGVGLVTNRFRHRTWFGRLLSRFLPVAKTLGYRQAERMEFRFAEPEEIQLDGDPFGEITAATLTVAAGALTLRT